MWCVWSTPGRAMSNSPTLSTLRRSALGSVILRDFSDRDDNVCYPYLWSGSTIIACERTDRTCYDVEIEPRYCEVVIQR